MESPNSCQNSGTLDLIAGPMYSGKCLGKNTPILMFDGTVKMVQDIIPGEQLMGDDSTPRNVLGICSGKSELFEVKPFRGDPYIINEHHILSLKCSHSMKKTLSNPNAKYKKGKVINIPVKEYIKESNTFKSLFKGYKVGVEFEPKPVIFDPYLLGVWLGDGHSDASAITTVDKEIIMSLKDYSNENNLILRNSKNSISYYISSGKPNGNNSFLRALTQLNVRRNKHIPHCYKANSREIRLKILAGLLDTDGYYNPKRHSYEITQKVKVLADDIVFIARSLGMVSYSKPVEKYCTYKGEKRGGIYYRVSIRGSCLHDIPCRLKRKQAIKYTSQNNLLTGIEVNSIGYGEYYGFEIDGNHLFLLGDFTVTHNTTELLRRLFNEAEVGLEVLYINHSSDNRSEGAFSTHNPLYRQKLSGHSNVTFKSGEKLSDIINFNEKFDVIGIDEGQFFSDLYDTVIKLVEEYSTHVIISGLNGDFRRNKIGSILDLEPLSDSYTKLVSFCKICAETKTRTIAPFTLKIKGQDFSKITEVGGRNMYIPVCRICYQKNS